MPNYVVVHQNESGAVSVGIPADGGKRYVDVFPEHPYPTGPRRLETDLEQIERLARGALIKTTKDLPSNRNFRDAWRLDQVTKAVVVDMQAAREIHRGNLRQAREAMLAQLDMDYLRADETNDVALKASIVARKRALRDLPQDPRIEAAATPEQLEATWPTVELGPSPYP